MVMVMVPPAPNPECRTCGGGGRWGEYGELECPCARELAVARRDERQRTAVTTLILLLDDDECPGLPDPVRAARDEVVRVFRETAGSR